MPRRIIGEIVADLIKGEVEFVLGRGRLGRGGDDESTVIPAVKVPFVVLEKLGGQLQLGRPVGIGHPTHAEHAMLPQAVGFRIVHL